jgi:hypothetical protein
MISMLSPLAPPFEKRVEFVRQLSRLGIQALIRFDPVFIHLFQALYGDSWFEEIESLINIFASTGAEHIVCSTGRLSKKRSEGDSLWHKMLRVIQVHSATAARRFEQEYCYEREGTSQGYLLRKDLRLQFHRKLKALVESRGMTYSTCQELSTEESDSSGLATCQRFVLPFAKKQGNGKFEAIEGCTANCHVSCRGLTRPPCGQPRLISPNPFKISYLRGSLAEQGTLFSP